MCCLFGIIDYQLALSQAEKNYILNCLAVAAEARGTDATGIAFNANGNLHIFKRPAAAHKLHLHAPARTKVIMGHTRMTTQGAAKMNQNNHPFPGKTRSGRFAFAHNGVLNNEHALRKACKLPKTNIETDSYVAVQLIEKKNSLDMDSLKYMAEQVEGSFTFTALDDKDNLFLVKGNNPLALIRLPNGVMLYASTAAILYAAVSAAGIDSRNAKEIKVNEGEILQLSPDGTTHEAFFNVPMPSLLFPRSCALPTARHSSKRKPDQSYRKMLESYAAFMGVPEEEMSFLRECDLTDSDLELALYDDYFRESCLEMFGYYGEIEEDGYDCFSCYGW